MGVYRRRDSLWYWLYLERKGRPGIREATRIPSTQEHPHQTKELRRQAEAIYNMRMSELARVDSFSDHERTPGPGKRPILQKSPKGWCYLYFVQEGQMVKIGRTVNPNKRMSTLQAGNGRSFHVPLFIPGHAVLEAAIHARFAHLKEQGEWFRLEPALKTFIHQLEAGANPIVLLWAPSKPIGSRKNP